MTEPRRSVPEGPEVPCSPARIDIETFYMGLLLALAARGIRGFHADGPQFHHAFGAVVEAARAARSEVVVEDMEWMGEDPTYGHWPAADALLAFGMSARLLTLRSPDLVRADLRGGPPARARAFLEAHIGHVEWFEQLAAAWPSRARA